MTRASYLVVVTTLIPMTYNGCLPGQQTLEIDQQLEQKLQQNSSTSDSLESSDPIIDQDPETPSAASTFPLSDSVFFVGHSLVSPTLPEMIENLVSSQVGGTGFADYQVINGSPLAFNWDNGASAQGANARTIIPQGRHQVLVITEAVPLLNHTTWSDSNGNALRYYNLAMNASANNRVYLYETWHCINSGTSAGCAYDENDHIPWRARLDSELARWESIANFVNAQKQAPQRPMSIVPAGQALAHLHDEIAAGRVAGMNSSRELFTDDIHLSHQGFYFIAMVHYATLYGRSPIGLPNSIPGFGAPTAAQARRFQEIAWETVCNYSRSGVICED